MADNERRTGADRRAGPHARSFHDPLAAIVEGVTDYAIFMLDRDGYVLTWNPGAERIKGYSAEEIVGRHFSVFYPPEDVSAAKPQGELEVAAAKGGYQEEGWRIRKDGSRFWATVSITPLWAEGRLRGFAKLTRDDTERRRAIQERLRLEILQTEERIGQELHQEVAQRLFAIGLGFQGALSIAHEPEMASRLEAGIAEIDQLIGHIRATLWSGGVRASPELLAEDSSEPQPDSWDGPSDGMRILVVDDDPDMRVLLSQWLQEVGTVATVSDAYQALDILDAEPVDVMVLDLLLPGAGGVGLLGRLNSRGRHIPTVVVTGMDSDDPKAELAREAGATTVMTKPFDRRLFLAGVLDAARHGTDD